MHNKKQRKAVKRAHTAMRIRTQDQWIEDAFGLATDDKRERQRLFNAAVKMLGHARQIVPTGRAS